MALSLALGRGGGRLRKSRLIKYGANRTQRNRNRYPIIDFVKRAFNARVELTTVEPVLSLPVVTLQDFLAVFVRSVRHAERDWLVVCQKHTDRSSHQDASRIAEWKA